MKEWIVGRNPVYETLRAKRRQVFRILAATGVEQKGRLLDILSLAGLRRVPVEWTPRARLDSLGENPQGIAAEVGAYPHAALQDIIALAKQRDEPLFVLLLDMVQNPQNLGTLMRSAEAAGVHGLVIPPNRAADVTPAVVHASAGASEHLLVAQANLAQSIDRLKQEGAWVIGLEGSPNAQPVENVRLDGALALVVGSEGEGLRQLVRQSCDVLVRLPMRGQVESLNAAVAGSIVLYLALQARTVRARNDLPGKKEG